MLSLRCLVQIEDLQEREAVVRKAAATRRVASVALALCSEDWQEQEQSSNKIFDFVRKVAAALQQKLEELQAAR